MRLPASGRKELAGERERDFRAMLQLARDQRGRQLHRALQRLAFQRPLIEHHADALSPLLFAVDADQPPDSVTAEIQTRLTR